MAIPRVKGKDCLCTSELKVEEPAGVKSTAAAARVQRQAQVLLIFQLLLISNPLDTTPHPLPIRPDQNCLELIKSTGSAHFASHPHDALLIQLAGPQRPGIRQRRRGTGQGQLRAVYQGARAGVG